MVCGLTVSTGETMNSYTYTMVHKVNAIKTFWTVTAGDNPNKPIKNELLQLTNSPHNNKNHN